MAATSPSGGPTPPQDEQLNGLYASYVPHDLVYNADFEDSLMRAALDPDAKRDGIRIIPSGSTERAQEGLSVHLSDALLQSLPIIAEDELPLPLNDSRRIYASPVPGVKLTHPGGYIEGGPGLAPNMDTFPDDYFQNNPEITSADEFRKARTKEVEASIELLKERLRARQGAKEKNEQIEKQLQKLREEHDMELRVHNKMAEVNRQKKEARERRKKEKEGG
ncbi:hypothetical protein LTR56_018295 [Elasticomyces elasticus]|nr:hypothetical protein LTR56_018295 [Elasticomyces elasticus]KAK3636785.1 hypothetical protein LTR22_018600 [Elasticomyces elasticus]KAK4912352.1 hypothetical protein LTR49_019170 [Elasticomyces elasticus]KAK5751854.1 hypothetical protein LTS12_018095 [Elasticomyces elasticus]